MQPKGYFSYIRVSTVRQGQTGTSLTEQRAAIERYSSRWALSIVKEFEEQETAAKLGRPIFREMLRALKRGVARGVIIHKIDRSARNLKDWAELDELIDQGIEVHFANESLDLYTRGGRLSADIQAVVAADYIRNLREEVKKGFYGRLKQGLSPLPAPIGYTNEGAGKAKAPDSVQGPLVRRAFQLYATGDFSIRLLLPRMYDLGLRTKRGHRVGESTMLRLLRNAFYTGVIKIKRRGEIFAGIHKPIVSTRLFNQVQDMLNGKKVEKALKHFFLFRRMARCGSCNTTLVGEKQKGHHYYRCQVVGCPQKTIREEKLEEAFVAMLQSLSLNEMENKFLRREIVTAYDNLTTLKEVQSRALTLQIEQIKTRLSNLTDAFIDGSVEKEVYLEKKNRLIFDQQAAKEQLTSLDEIGQQAIRKVEQFLELANSAYLTYKMTIPEERRDFVKVISSNLIVTGKTVSIKLHFPFHVIANRETVPSGGAQRDVDRTLLALLSQLREHFKENELYPKEEEKHEPVRINPGRLKVMFRRANGPRYGKLTA
jgi:site-specific DNA recombinase